MRRRQVSRTQTTSLVRRFANSGPVLPFNPASSIPGCQLWLDAADTSTVALDSSSSVFAWLDKSGNGNTVTQATSANQPTYVTNVVNGNPVIRFNGTSHVLQTTSFTSLGTNSVSFWLVERNLSNSGGGGAPFSFNSGPNGGIVFQNNNGLQPLGNSVPYTSSVARIVFYNRTNTGSGDSTYLNGTVITTRDDNTTGTYGSTFAVGMRIPSTIYTSGDICEILIFTGMPTTSQRQKIEGYLAHKWGLAGPSPTIPLSILGCGLWLDAADSSTITGTSNVTAWRDKASALTLSGSGSTYTSVNGYPTITFNGNQFASTTNLPYEKVCTSNANFTTFIVQSTSSSSAVNGIPFTIYITDNVRRLAVFSNGGGSGGIFIDGASQGSPRLGGITQTLNTSQLLTITRKNITTMTVRLNGSQVSSADFPGAINFISSNSYFVYISHSTGPWSGNMYEIIHYNRDMSDSEIQQVESYLTKKWGQSSLPTNHPYKSAAPKYEDPVFLPTLITGNQLWLDAADISTITYGTGSSVASWRDKINGYAVANSSPAYQPVYSQGTIRFNGTISPSYLDIPTLTIGSSTFSIFFVIQNTGPASGNAYAPHFFWPLSGNGSGALSITSWINTNIQGVNANISSTLLKNQYYVISYTFGVTTNFEQLYANGISIGTYQNSSAYTASLYRLGTIDSSQSVTLFDGNIGEMLVYNAAVTLSQRQKIEGYLAHKWKIQSSLPANHPFKSTAPTTIPKSLTIQSLSALFSPSSKALSIPSKSSFTLGTNNHTIEFWFYQTNRTTYDVTFSYGDNPPVWTGTSTYIFQAGNPHSTCILGNGAGGWAVELFKGGNSYALNTWHHFAIVRNGTTFTLYINGTSHSTATSSVSIGPSFGSMVIGSLTSTGHVDGFTGYISNFRFVNGTAVYTSNFTPPTSPLTAIPNTQVLIQGLVDRSPNAYAVTNNGNVSLSLLSPFV